MGEETGRRDARSEPPSAETTDPIGTEIRVRLVAATLLLAAVMALPIITSFTSLLNGFVGGVGAGYVAGLGEFVLAMGGAVAYCRWADRREDGR
jgi:hypothetical protein